MHQLREIMANPTKLKSLDLKLYESELMRNERQSLFKIIQKVIDELNNPFKDPREYRSMSKQHLTMSNERLFYLLIEESKRSFKEGLMVTATVTKVFDSKAICRLDNGLSAVIMSSNILDADNQDNLKEMLDFGRIIQGRIEKIAFVDQDKFEV